MKKKIILITLMIVGILSTGCGVKQYDSDIMHNKAAYLSKLTRKTQVLVRRNISDGTVMHSYMDKKFPKLMDQFDGYSLFFKDHNGTAVLLLCDKDKTKALVEDASCTGRVEGGDFFEQELTCEFHLDISSICGLSK